MTLRLRFLSLILAFALSMGVTAFAYAAPSGATSTIRTVIGEVLSIIKNPDMRDEAKRPALLQQIENKVQTIFDFAEFSMRTVGPTWRTFTPDQKQRFITAFAALLRASYIDKLEGYNGEEVRFTGEIASTKGDKVEVESVVQIKDKAVPVAYRMLERNGKWVVYDVLIEKVSLVETYRN